MLSKTSRTLTYLTGLLYAVLGVALFALPEQLAPVFAWTVTPFMTMTLGGWCLGNAWLAWITARRWKWRLVYTALVYLWLFGLLELAVVLVFRARLALGHPIAWLYFTALGVNVLTAAVGAFDWLRIRPLRQDFGPPVLGVQRITVIAYVLFVGFLGVYGMIAPLGAPGTNGGIFPELMSPFTLRSFAAFYLSLSLTALPLVFERNLATRLHHSIASYGLIVAITAAAFVYIRLFDFSQRPGGLVYFGVYLLVGISLLFVFRRFGTGNAGG